MIANFFVGFVAAIHVYILILEMFLWRTPRGLRIFRQTAEQAKVTELLAKNQGLYNGFLAAGLIWSILVTEAPVSTTLKIFFLSCVTIAGIYGAITVNRRIFFVQSFPAILAMFLTYFAV